MPTTLDGWLWWFFTAIILGIVGNLVARKLEAPTDELYKKIRGKISARSESKQREIKRLLDLMLSDSSLATLLYSKAQRHRNDESFSMLGMLSAMLAFLFIVKHNSNSDDFFAGVLVLLLAITFALGSAFAGNRRVLLSEVIDKYEQIKGIAKTKI